MRRHAISNLENKAKKNNPPNKTSIKQTIRKCLRQKEEEEEEEAGSCIAQEIVKDFTKHFVSM